MKTTKLILTWAALLSVAFNLQLHAQSSAFTYQGSLSDNGSPATGIYDLQFTIYAAATNGVALGAVTNTATEVSGGGFTVMLDFGTDLFDGSDRWLEIGAVTNGGGPFETLAPRQPLTPVPYALRALSVNSNGLSGGTYANAVTFDNAANLFNGSFEGTLSGDGAGVTNVNAGTVQGMDTQGTVVSAGRASFKCRRVSTRDAPLPASMSAR